MPRAPLHRAEKSARWIAFAHQVLPGAQAPQHPPLSDARLQRRGSYANQRPRRGISISGASGDMGMEALTEGQLSGL